MAKGARFTLKQKVINFPNTFKSLPLELIFVPREQRKSVYHSEFDRSEEKSFYAKIEFA